MLSIFTGFRVRFDVALKGAEDSQAGSRESCRQCVRHEQKGSNTKLTVMDNRIVVLKDTDSFRSGVRVSMGTSGRSD
ncbi:hypothetical protein CSA37_00915 [Candidatus Fermentibacteria bacterium]|nr:MAG: hypothetical protein CSA37_00915 [Candidatus Fermentibacteria bacterium]